MKKAGRQSRPTFRLLAAGLAFALRRVEDGPAKREHGFWIVQSKSRGGRRV
ncbi:TPA: hypothetical protein NV998_004335 [Escherichia coli]|uniref:hypothetical protein n=1 Tax=Escherichia coli TaxID=562 RepID=UPI001810E2B2|nr:hypothetical protein [Escherichia coli]EFM6529563.1 hypothetical protein [Escherichia coli]MCR6190082.1 hypothetical protein [Escherichia coli]MCR6211823.1 hypothetical protein [Escherichia coli]HCJ9631105.1 hypothetical protein [Escherichia coli]HCY2030262.1 hypothetical protein [Escherichia coli]